MISFLVHSVVPKAARAHITSAIPQLNWNVVLGISLNNSTGNQYVQFETLGL